jgi:glycosyltransferase involved in cell wall biosynthesis
MSKKTKILFFIGSLKSGGKERRLVELLTYLNETNKYHLFLLTKKRGLSFKKILDLDVTLISLDEIKNKVSNFSQFYRAAQKINPDIIHTWGSVQTLTVLPYIILKKNVKLVNSQITAAPPKVNLDRKIINKINFLFSDVILSNSFAGIEAFNPPLQKSKVIYNGMNLLRFENLSHSECIRKEFGIEHKFVVIMVASYSKNKDYLRFFKVGIELSKLRNDTAFLGVGFFDKDDEKYYKDCVELTSGHNNLKALSGTSKVESLVNACDIGVLFSNTKIHGEGISNSLIEYMALGKPVIANDAGGTKEIIVDGENGYLFSNDSAEFIASKINDLLNCPIKMEQMGGNSKKRILKEFSLSRMGLEFEKTYQDVLI